MSSDNWSAWADERLDSGEDLACEVSQHHAAAGAAEQPGFALAFQCSYVAADDRLRQVQGDGGVGQAAEFGDLDEHRPSEVDDGCHDQGGGIRS